MLEYLLCYAIQESLVIGRRLYIVGGEWLEQRTATNKGNDTLGCLNETIEITNI